MMKMDHQGQVVTLAMMISGIVISRHAQLSAMSSEIPTETKEKSIEVRMRRWVKNELDVEARVPAFCVSNSGSLIAFAIGSGDGG